MQKESHAKDAKAAKAWQEHRGWKMEHICVIEQWFF
jgi:hypothetical protein